MERMSPPDILIVEDSPTQAEELQYILEKNGYQAVTAHNGREAIEMLLTLKPVLVISDILMPEMDGFDLCKRIKDNDDLKEIPVILLTALSDPGDVLRGLECGADNFITKPYDEKYLIDRIHHMLINTELRKESQVQTGVKLFFKGKKYFITSERQQILDLLLSTYETAVMQNCELKTAQEKLEVLNEQLERKVEERTVELIAEIEERIKAEEEINRRALQEVEDLKKRQKVERALREETIERLRAVEALREKEQMLIQQSRQAAMGEMIGNIAHQWRQPLNALGLNVQQLLLFYDYGELTREFLDDSVSSSMELILHMSRTIDDFRNYFRPDKEKVEFKVAEAIENTLSLIEDSFKNQHIGIEVVAKNDPAIFGYRNEFAQALLNILNNARDALTERGNDDPRVTIIICTEGDRAVVTISDNAGGIPEEIIGKIFDPYFTTKGPQAGTGVGLFMSKTIIEKNMGGSLAARNIANGAEFRIEV